MSSTVLFDNAETLVGRHDSESSLRLLIVQTMVQAKRILVRLGRTPMTIVHAVLLPIVFLVALDVVLGDRISSITGHSALYAMVPLNVVSAAISGSMAGAISLAREYDDGLLSRLWVLPVHRASGLLARFVAEAIRVLVTTTLILCAGLILGFRFEQGVLAGLAWFSVPIIFGSAVATLIMTVALYWAKTTLVEAITIVHVLALLFSTGFVPLAQFPAWMRPLVEHQPMSYAVEAMRGLSLGGPVLSPMIGVALWSAGITAACLVPLIFGYQKASMRGVT